MNYSVRLEAHESGACCVSSHRIVRKNNLSERAGRAIEWPVPFHCHNAVGDNEVDREGRTYIKNAFLNALPMENVLGPAVPRPGHDAEHVLQTQRNASPVMGFYFGHRDQKIGLQHCPREPKALHPHVVRAQLRANQFVAIEIDKTDRLRAEGLLIAAF